MEMDSAKSVGIFDNLVDRIREIKYDFSQQKKAYFLEKFNQLEKWNTEFNSIDWNNPDASYHYGGKAHMPAYEYLELLRDYESKREKYLSEIDKIDRKSYGFKHDIINPDENYGTIKHDPLMDIQLNLKYETTIDNLLIKYQKQFTFCIDVPTDPDLLRDSIVSFQSGDFFAFIGVDGVAEKTITNNLDGRVIYSQKYSC